MAKDKKFSPKVKQKLILPLLNAKMDVGDSIYIKATGKMYIGKPQKDAKEGQKPADMLPCINLETGEEGEIIVAAIVKSVLDEKFPDGKYVGKGFGITKGDKPKGKRYFQYMVDEIEV